MGNFGINKSKVSNTQLCNICLKETTHFTMEYVYSILPASLKF